MLIVTFQIFLSATTVHADEVFFANGDRISGGVTKISGGQIQITTRYAGVITADFGEVADIKADGVVHISPANGEIVEGKIVAVTAEIISIETSGGEMLELPRADFAEINVLAPAPETQEGAPQKLPAESPKIWSGSVSVGVQAQRGNTDTTKARAEAKAKRKTDRDELDLRVLADYGETDGETDRNKIFGQAKLKRFQTERRYIFGIIDAEHDEMQDLDLRAQVFGGLGYLFVKTERTTLLGEAALGVVAEDFNGPGAEDNVEGSGLLNAEWTQRILDNVIFYQAITYFPSLAGLEDYRLRSESTLTTPLGGGWALKLSLIDEYDNNPESNDVDRNDLWLIGGVEYKF
jgi:putative salt-induced outer membrane protein YdiY